MGDLREVFTRHDLRCTKQRREIYEALRATKEHPTAEQLHKMVNRTNPGTSLATIYNTLEALCRSGLCRRLSTPEGVARFDADLSDHLHVLTTDGQVRDVPAEMSRAILDQLCREKLKELESRMGVSISRVSIQLIAQEGVGGAEGSGGRGCCGDEGPDKG